MQNKITIKFLDLVFNFLLYLKFYKLIKVIKYFLRVNNLKSIKLYFTYSKIYLSQNKLIIAEIILRKYLQTYEIDCLAESYMGLIKLYLGETSYSKSIIYKLDKLNFKNLIFNLLKTEYFFFIRKIGIFKYYAKKCLNVSNKFNYLYEKLVIIAIEENDFKGAEYYANKLIKFKKFFPNAMLFLSYINLYKGNIILGKELITKLICKFPKFFKGYYLFTSLSLHKKYPKLKKIILNNDETLSKLDQDKIGVLFSKAKIFKDEKNYVLCAEYLIKANQLKLKYFPSNYNFLINQSIFFQLNFVSSQKDLININKKNTLNKVDYIFIVGLPRSGSTLLEKILSANKNIISIGESSEFEKYFLSWYKNKDNFNYPSLSNKVILDKNLFNFKYTGYICELLPTARVIHCVRNPMDNIFSLYSSNLLENNFSSSLEDSSKFLLHQKQMMDFYKNIYRDKIFTVNYEDVVLNSKKCILKLINWLGFDWSDDYLNHQKIKSTCTSASFIQVRKSIYNSSVDQWKNYEKLLKPAAMILKKQI